MNSFALARLVLCSAACALPLSALEQADVTVTVDAGDGSAAIHHQITIAPGHAASEYLTVAFTNASSQDVRLTRVTLAFPWTGPAGDGAMLATGGGCMFNSPTCVHPQPETATFSTSFLLAQTQTRHTFAGFLTWRTFRSEMLWRDGRIVVTAEGEGRRLRPGETLHLEKIWLAGHASWQDLLYAYADEIVRENKITLRPHPQWIGWSNWDYYGSRFTVEQIRSNLDRLVEMNLGANLLQIDGGWATRSGDFLLPRPELGGMKELADEFRRRGLAPGVHLDGMRADHDSQVVRQHPEYFLKDQHGQILGMEAAKKSGKRSRVYYDFSHPGAREHMRQAIHTLRHEWGYDYFKFDFLKFALPKFIYQDTPGLSPETQIVPFNDALTSVERSHLAMATFREAMGPDAYFMACTAEFGMTYGHVDALRTGGDIDPTYSRFSRACMENGGNFYLHRKVVFNDADYHVARGRLDEDESLVKNPRKTGGDMPYAMAEMWTHYVGLFGGPKISGDNLNILRSERKDLFRRAVTLPACDRYVPIDFWQHARDRDDPFGVFLGEAAETVYLAIFNWSAEPRTFTLRGLTPAQAGGLRSIAGRVEIDQREPALALRLAGHSSAVFQCDPATRFDQLRTALVLVP